MELPHFADLLARRLEGIIQLSAPQIGQLYSHFVVLLKWNEGINLTSVRSPEEMITRHYCESIFFALHLPEARQGAKIADVGSGAGFPGVPMAVLRPDWQLTLIESHQRKSVFLRESARVLRNVRVLAERAEVVSEQFDWLVSRAVRAGDVLAQVPRLSPRVGLLVGESDLPELTAQRTLTWGAPIPIPWSERRFCVYGEFHVEQYRNVSRET